MRKILNKKRIKDTIEPKLEEGIDCYMEGKFVVFTEKFLRQRGYCCQSGCRHCPYSKREKVT